MWLPTKRATTFSWQSFIRLKCLRLMECFLFRREMKNVSILYSHNRIRRGAEKGKGWVASHRAAAQLHRREAVWGHRNHCQLTLSLS